MWNEDYFETVKPDLRDQDINKAIISPIETEEATKSCARIPIQSLSPISASEDSTKLEKDDEQHVEPSGYEGPKNYSTSQCEYGQATVPNWPSSPMAVDGISGKMLELFCLILLMGVAIMILGK